VDREARLLRQRQQMMTLEEAILLAQTLTGIIPKHVTDPAVVERIGREWAQVIELSPDAVEVVGAGRS
jgi:hypothetical protein